ncbi:MAG TPA: penicillin-binding transpeptidase domain-containing protein, partial [Candidatus Levybacteria bacterium]|nr:penicillin-binding transpeptidase domain-containing protein [Candidatus Levybacteria bacterium]
MTYTLALENGYTEATMVDDSPLTIASSDGGPSYTPVNYDGRYHGRQTLRNAFANSYNIPAVRVAQRLGVDKILNFGRSMGVTTWEDPRRYGLSITLGGGETKMVDLATVFGTIANDGTRVDLNPILSVADAYGNSVYTKEETGEQVVSEGTAFIISDILADNDARSAAFGTSSPLNIPGKRVSVKTGTTDNKRDNWTVGFTDEFVVATWVGNNDNTPMSPELTSGISGAAPMWNSIMTKLIENKNQATVSVPPSVVSRNCYGKTTYFVRGTENAVNCRFSPNR